MKPNLSDHQFLESDDIIVVQSKTDSEYTKADTKNVKLESLREDIRNYVDGTTTKELKVFTSGRSVTGGRIDVLDNETLYYYPATPVGSLNDENINLTSGGDFFDDIDTQKEYNEKMYNYASDIELSLETNNKFLDAIIASTEFVGPDDAPDHVKHFTTYNAYPQSGTEKGLVVNVNDLSSVEQSSVEGDIDLQNQINDAERRISALFNVKFNSGYFVYKASDPTTDLPGPGQIKFDEAVTAERVFSIHARSYDPEYGESQLEDPVQATVLNNYIVINVNDSIVAVDHTYKVVSVEVVDDSVPIDEKIFIIKATLATSSDELTDGVFTTVRVVADGEFDPGSLEGVYVKTTGDIMTGQLTVRRPNSNICFKTESAEGADGLKIYSGGKTITQRTVFESQEYVTKTFVEDQIASADLDAYVKKLGDLMTGTLEIRGGGRLKVNVVDSGQNTNLQLMRNNELYISMNGSNSTNDKHISLQKQTKLQQEGTAAKDLVTKAYVDSKAGKDGTNGTDGKDGADFKITTGTSTPSSLSKGDMFLNTGNNILYIGL